MIVPTARLRSSSRTVFTVLFAYTVPATSCLAAPSPWNGAWTLDRSRPEPDGAATGYAFSIDRGGRLRWQIPSLKENNTGHLDGKPFPINRPGAARGLTLSVQAEGPRVLRYKVADNGKPQGEGRMTLAPNGRSWTDVPLDHGRPVAQYTMVYRRK